MSVRNNPFARNAPPSPGSSGVGRPKSAIFTASPSPLSPPSALPLHTRNQSHASLAMAVAPPIAPRHGYSHSQSNDFPRGGTPGSSTFAPSFIKSEEMRKNADAVNGIEGENDFSGKKYVWLKDPQTAFVKGWVLEDLGGGRIVVQCDDGSVSSSSVRNDLALIQLLTWPWNSNVR